MNNPWFCPLKAFKARALARPDVRQKYEELKEEFELLDEMLKARTQVRFN